MRLSELARRTGRTKTFLAREAILLHVEDLEDSYLARKRLERGGERVSLDDLEREISR